MPPRAAQLGQRRLSRPRLPMSRQRCWTRPPSWPTRGGSTRPSRPASDTFGTKDSAPSAYYLMGMICQAAGDRRRAEECFRKTVYLDPKA